jgi:hypothetical protein
MDIFFQDPSDIPLPPEEVRIRQFRAEPWPDGRRVRVLLELTPFQKRPNSEVCITDSQGEEIANISIIETIDPKMEFTMHLPALVPAGQYTVSATLFYTDPLPQPAENTDTSQPLELPASKVVDHASTTFMIQGE